MFQIIKKVFAILDKRQKRNAAILVFMMIIGAFLEMIGVSLMLPLVSAITQPDIIETNKYAKMVCDVFDLHSSRTFLILMIVAMMGVFIVKNVYLIVEYYFQYRFAYNCRFTIQKKLLSSYLGREYAFYLNVSTGEIVRVMQNDVTNISGVIINVLNLAMESVIALGLGITIFLIDPFITVFVAIMLSVLMFVITKILKPRLRLAGQVLQDNGSMMSTWLLQSIYGIKELKVMQKEAFFEKNYDFFGKKYVHADKKNSVLGSVPRLMIEMVSMCSMLLMIAVMIYYGRELETMFPVLSAFAMAAMKLLPSVNRISTAVNALPFAEPSLDKVLEQVVEIPKNSDNSKQEQSVGEQIKKIGERVQLSNICFHYPDSDAMVLEHANLEIPVGKTIGLVGASGAGKTTAVDVLLGLLKPQEGCILVDGCDIRKDYKGWLSQIGYIPQMIFLMDGSIRENIAFGVLSEEINDARVWEVLAEAKLDDYVKLLPKGLDTQIGERGIRLSGGQRQRIGIARALYTDPQLLVFDEATSALDNETETAIMESINALHGTKTMIIIAHRLQTIEGCDVVYRVEEGKIKRVR